MGLDPDLVLGMEDVAGDDGCGLIVVMRDKFGH